MDAKSKAEFINAIASGSGMPCPKCGAVNKADSRFCIVCGTALTASQEAPTGAPAFAPIAETAPSGTAAGNTADVRAADVNPAAASTAEVKPAAEKPAEAKEVKYVAPENVFAQGLPAWSVEPPQVMVRRH